MSEAILGGWREANGKIVRYQLCGKGPRSVVLIHEMGGTLETWSAVTPFLPPHWRVLTYDVRGFGMSEKIIGDITIDDLADDLFALITDLGLATPVALAGVAVGAAVAIHFAATKPELVSALMPISPACSIPAERRAAAIASANAFAENGRRAPPAGVDPYPAELRDESGAYDMFRARGRTSDARSQAAHRRMLANLEMDQDFAVLRCPTLFVGATLDQYRPAAATAEVAKAVPGARFVELRTGHFAPMQTPGLVAREMTAFFDAAANPGQKEHA